MIDLDEHLRQYVKGELPFQTPAQRRKPMDTVEVVRESVIAKLTENREKHKATFEEANANYRQVCVDALRKRADEVDGGAEIDLYFQLPQPEDHTEDYDEAISMLTWDQRDKIELDRNDFKAYVLDKWRWERSFAANTMSYSSSR